MYYEVSEGWRKETDLARCGASNTVRLCSVRVGEAAGAQGLARISKAHGRVQVQACCMSSTAMTFDDIELIFSSRAEKAGKAAKGGGRKVRVNPEHNART